MWNGKGVARSEGDGKDDLQKMQNIDVEVDLASSVSSPTEHITFKPNHVHLHRVTRSKRTFTAQRLLHCTVSTSLSLPLCAFSLLLINPAIAG
jgi:hypothetical protein